MSSKNLQKNTLYVGLVFVAMAISYQYFHMVQLKYLAVTSFKECVDAGYRVLSTYPETCIVYGKSFSNPLQKSHKPEDVAVSVHNNNDYKNQTYIVDGDSVSFHDGKGYLPPNFVLKPATTTLVIMDNPFMYDINNDSLQDTVLIMRTIPAKGERSSFYISSSVSLRSGFYGINAIFLDYSLLGAAFVYKNGEITVGYTIEEASTTLKQKYFVVENDILKQLSHK